MAISNFYLVCYFDNNTNELIRIEQYLDNNSAQPDVDSYKYGYYAKIYKPEELLIHINNQIGKLSRDLQEASDNYVKLDIEKVTQYNKLVEEYNQLAEQYNKLDDDCINWQKALDETHLLMLEKQDELIKKILQCKQLEDQKSLLEIQVTELTSPVDVKDCPHSIFNGEDIFCRYYEGCKCTDLDFVNCMFKENIRLKQKIQKLKEEVDAGKLLS